MFLTKISLFIIKFTCDKPNVTTTLIVYSVFQQGETWENNNKFTKTSKFWNIVEVLKHQKKRNRGSIFLHAYSSKSVL